MNLIIYIKLFTYLLSEELSSMSAPALTLEHLLKKKSEVFPKIQISHEESDYQQKHVSFFYFKDH